MTEYEIELIKLAQSGNRPAFEQLIFMYDKHVLNIAYTFRNNADDAKDIYQDVFIRVFNGIKNFKFESEFSTWIYRITVNLCITYKNKEKKLQHQVIDNSNDEDEFNILDIYSSEDITDELVIKNETKEIIEKAINSLPEKQKITLTMKYYNGMKIKEIAEIMNCNEGTVKRYLFNATNKLKKLLAYLSKN